MRPFSCASSLRRDDTSQSARPPRILDRVNIRTRLALVYALVTALVSIAFVGLTCVFIEHDLGSSVDSAIEYSSTSIAVRAEVATDPTMTESPAATAGVTPTFEPRAQQPLIVLARPCSTVSPRVNSPAGAICTELASDDQSAWLSSTRRVGQSISARLVTQLLSYSALVGGALIVAAAGLGWWLAGRSLRPVHRMAAAARRLATRNPHGRIPLHGPRDELRDLGETFNSLLDRLGAAFASQQRFAANAAHELRTPLTIQRATIQIGLEDVTIGPVELASIKEELLATNRRQEQLIDRLLTFARSDAGLDVIEPVDVRDLVRDSVNTLLPEARGRGVRVHTRIATIPTEGDPVLLRQLVTNLVQNAIRHNHEGGTVTVRTSGERRLTVINTGPEVAPEKITELFEPFHRLGKTRTESATGTGLGLSIVQSIAAAHNATLRVESNRNGGGLTITVTFPEPSGSDQLKHTELVATPS